MKPPTLRHARELLLMLAFLLVSSACQPTATAVTQTSSDTAPTVTQAAQAGSAQVEMVLGSGDFMLPNPGVGLEELSAYKATLTVSFTGTEAGQPSQWSTTSVMLYAKEPFARSLSIVETGNLSPADPSFLAEMNGAAYQVGADGVCVANGIDQENSAITRLVPAGLLDGLIGAEAAGHAAVNGVEADHYTFDQRALGLEGITQSNGEVWLASTGGYIVKYVLSTQGSPDYFGEGIEGSISWDYELTGVNIPVTPDLPQDCPAGMISVPQMLDATNVLAMPGLLEYDTAASQVDVVTFYQEKIPSLGWSSLGEPGTTDIASLLEFQQGDWQLSVIITPASGGARVLILQNRPPK